MIILKPPIGVKTTEIFRKGYYGKILFKFAEFNKSEKAKLGLHGTIFNGRVISYRIITDLAFKNATSIH